MSFLSGFWKPHHQEEEKRPKTASVGCEQAKNLIAQAVTESLGNTERAILSKHLHGCTPCQLEMIRQRQEKEEVARG
ncbi:MAG: hypothetical protein Q7S57_00255 [bacterium]|nr:hypothetical protein [bacterium]